MNEFISSLKEANVPTILIIGGILFLFLAIGGGFGAKIITRAVKPKPAGVIGSILLVFGILFALPLPIIDAQVQSQSKARLSEIIFNNGSLSVGYDLGVDSAKRNSDWVIVDNESIQMKYPGGQSWGAVFITIGKPTDLPRVSMDFSTYNYISFEAKGELGNENVMFGIKDNLDPDDGTEIKLPIKNITTKWNIYEYPLSAFSKANTRNLYVVAEFVFSASPATISIKNIRYNRK